MRLLRYGRSNLYSMVGVYEAFSSDDFAALVSKYGGLIVQPTAGQITGERPSERSIVKFPGGVDGKGVSPFGHGAA